MNKVCFYFECYYTGGMETFLVQLVNNWSGEDELFVLCNKSYAGVNQFAGKIKNPKCHFEVYPMSMVQDWEKNISNKYLARIVHILSFLLHVPYYILFGYKRLRLSRFDYLQIVNGGYPAGISSRCIAISWWLYTKKKCLHNFHNFTMHGSWLNELPNTLIDKWVIRSTNHFVSVSKICAESLRERRLFKNLENITYIYNGIGGEIVQPSFNLRSELHIKDGTFILMMMSTYEERKGHKFIVDVMSRVLDKRKDVHLVFIGYGTPEDMQVVHDYVSLMGLDSYVSILGYKTNAMEYLAQTDLLLIGSQSLESFGLTAIEAMKYHKVVLSTNTGGLKEVIMNGEGGYLFNKDDVDGMSSRIVSLIENPALLGEQANLGFKRYVENFTADRVAKDYRNLLIES